MKISIPVRKHTGRFMPCMITVMVTFAGAYTHAAPTPVAQHLFTLQYKDSIVVEKNVTSKKYKIRLYPNANQQVLFFSASGKEGKIYQLYLFDISGQLVKQANIRNKQTTVININDKGVYVFEVFIEDERIENGKVTVK